MFSNKEVNVTKICHDQVHRCIIITASNQLTTNLPKLTNLPKYVVQFQKQNLFKYQQGDFCFC